MIKRRKSTKSTCLIEVSLHSNISLFGSDTFISNFFFKRRIFTTISIDKKEYVLINTHKNIGPGKIGLQFKEK